MLDSDIKSLIKSIKGRFPTFGLNLNSDQKLDLISEWSYSLKYYTLEQCMKALEDYTTSEKYPPALSDFHQRLNKSINSQKYHYKPDHNTKQRILSCYASKNLYPEYSRDAYGRLTFKTVKKAPSSPVAKRL